MVQNFLKSKKVYFIAILDIKKNILQIYLMILKKGEE